MPDPEFDKKFPGWRDPVPKEALAAVEHRAGWRAIPAPLPRVNLSPYAELEDGGDG